MKMVAAAKMKKDQRLMESGMPFAQPAIDLFRKLPEAGNKGAITYFAVTSDKGLCGGVNSAVNKQVRLGLLDNEADGKAVKIMILGGKGVAGLKRLYGDRFTYSFEEISKLPFSFATASICAERIVKANPERLALVSNEFKSMVSYDTTVKPLLTVKGMQDVDKAEFSKAMDVYSFEPALYEIWDDLHEFYYGCVIYSANLQSMVTETSQRMSAMENATKNAGEMYGKVSLMFNRARQAKITTELCEIISGASAV